MGEETKPNLIQVATTDFNSIKLGLVRDVVKLLAGAMIAKGLIGEGFVTDARIEVVTGIVLTILTVLWSAWQKRMATKAVEVAISSPVTTTVQDVQTQLVDAKVRRQITFEGEDK